MKTALIFGISGQDGSYLAEYLLSLGYEVHGIVRRHSVAENQQYRLENVRENKNLHVRYGDLLDQSSIDKVLNDVMPDEIYSLAAQSHVRISFDIPQLTTQINSLGVVNILEAYKRICPQAKFYQASSSEMFGNSFNTDGFQSEETPMHPVSPYGCSKLFAFKMVQHYRRAYGLHACNGILFNHECISEKNPMIFKENNYIKIMRPNDLRKIIPKHGNKQQWSFDNKNLEIWDGYNFVKFKTLTATKVNNLSNDFKSRITNTRNGIIETTNHHNLINENHIKNRADTYSVGDKLLHSIFPNISNCSELTLDEAEFLGLMVADGSISNIDGKYYIGNFSNNNLDIRNRLSDLYCKLSLGYTKTDIKRKTEFGESTSMRLNGNNEYLKYLFNQIYTFDNYKKIPERILNAPNDIKISFLNGYNSGDGLKSNPCNYMFKNFKTNSSILALGLIYLIDQTTKQTYNITFEEDEKYYGYYSINFHTINDTNVGKHLLKNNVEIKKILYHSNQPKWVYDIETESGKFMCGVGNIIIANSPRRGSNFVTSKVVKTACMIKLGMESKLELGNMDSYRDWGHSKDYVKAMYMILNSDEADDYVVSTMVTHSVREMCDVVFKYLGLNYEDYVVQNPKFLRPEELKYLKGDSTKMRSKLNWKPTYAFEQLMHEMCDHWMDELQGKKSYR